MKILRTARFGTNFTGSNTKECILLWMSDASVVFCSFFFFLFLYFMVSFFVLFYFSMNFFFGINFKHFDYDVYKFGATISLSGCSF